MPAVSIGCRCRRSGREDRSRADWPRFERRAYPERRAERRRRLTARVLRAGLRRARVERARALQHRRRRLRQAPADKLAMVWERFDGATREVTWGELQDLANQAAHVLRDARRRARRPRRRRPAADRRDRGDLLRHLEARRDPALDVGALRRRRHPPPPRGLRADACSSPTRPTRRASTPSLVDELLVLDDGPARRRLRPSTICEDTAADDPAQLYYTSGTTGQAKGIVHAHRYILAHEEFVYCHDVQDGERFHGMGEWAWAAGIAPLLGPWRLGARPVRLPARGRLRPARAARLPLPQRGHERLHDADRDAGDDGDRRRRRARTRRSSGIVCSAGEPLNPEAIRWFREQYGVTVLDYYGLTESYPLCANFPFMEVREGSMGRPMPGWDVQLLDEDEQPGRAGRARRDLPARPLEPALPARLLAQRGGQRGDLRRRVVPLQGRRDPGRGRLRLVRGPRRRRDHRRRLPDRPVRGRVRLPRARRGRRGRRRRLARRGQGQRRQGVHRPRRGPRALRRARRRDQAASSAAASAPTPTRARSSSSTTCRRR